MALLTTPLVTPKLTFPNRLTFTAVSTSSAENGKVTPTTLDFFRRRSRGFGLVVVEHAYVSRWGCAGPKMLSVSTDDDVEGLQALADLLHENGCKAFLQLDHGGGWSIPALQQCLDPEKNPEGRLITQEIEDKQLAQVAADFGAAAARARRAGFDGVQIKACHVYLLSQFYSPLTNRRASGRYPGTSFEGRMRLTLDVLASVRHSVGEDYPISVRFAVQDYDPLGSTMEESARAAVLLQESGVDLLDLSGGPKYRYFHPKSTAPGWFGEDAAQIKRGLDIPVLTAGGLTTAEEAEQLLQSGRAELAGVCRAALKNENWAREALDALR
ncbi:MAG: NADH:flavin oxidoreductase [Clostridia bacterium]|nr:NADH:flavin oxidoreductase [Clostridia bacterium]